MELDKKKTVVIARGHRLKMVYEIFMAVLAFISVIFIWNDHPFIRNLDFVIWVIFVLDVSVRFFSSENKWAYIKRNPLDLVAIIPLDSIFRLARLVRFIRLLRTLAILKHYAQPVYDIFRTNNLDKVLIVLVVLIFLTSIPITMLEPGIAHYSDAVW
ncbi:ion transporter [Halalkalibacter oceani]|uniref:ion transporter n=1 Tax=Halalkalibacter oceani TaxID=1653776 RepID=UPI003395640A